MELRRPSRERWNNPSALERVGLNSGPNGLLGSLTFCSRGTLRGPRRGSYIRPGWSQGQSATRPAFRLILRRLRGGIRKWPTTNSKKKRKSPPSRRTSTPNSRKTSSARTSTSRTSIDVDVDDTDDVLVDDDRRRAPTSSPKRVRTRRTRSSTSRRSCTPTTSRSHSTSSFSSAPQRASRRGRVRRGRGRRRGRRQVGPEYPDSAQAAGRVRVPFLLPGEAPEPAGRSRTDALHRLRVGRGRSSLMRRPRGSRGVSFRAVAGRRLPALRCRAAGAGGARPAAVGLARRRPPVGRPLRRVRPASPSSVCWSSGRAISGSWPWCRSCCSCRRGGRWPGPWSAGWGGGAWTGPPVVAAVWVLVEAGRGRVPFGGFPWGDVGYAFHDWGPARAVAAWGGVSLVSWVAVAVNGLLLDAVPVRPRSGARWGGRSDRWPASSPCWRWPGRRRPRA